MPPVQLAALACTVALLAGLGVGLAANSGGGGDSAAAVKPDATKLTRLAAPAIGAVQVPALKLPRSHRGTKRAVTAAPPPPPAPTVVTPPPPPVVIRPPAAPPPPPPPAGGPDVTRR
jgi:hypothetical protein